MSRKRRANDYRFRSALQGWPIADSNKAELRKRVVFFHLLLSGQGLPYGLLITTINDVSRFNESYLYRNFFAVPETDGDIAVIKRADYSTQ